MSKTVHRIAAPLAEHEISILQMSTYSADYTLVAEEKLKDALDCLRPHFHVLNNDALSSYPSQLTGNGNTLRAFESILS
jgi:hypothetical protein